MPNDFANRIGRLIKTRGALVEALFDPNAPPEILSELAVSERDARHGYAGDAGASRDHDDATHFAVLAASSPSAAAHRTSRRDDRAASHCSAPAHADEPRERRS